VRRMTSPMAEAALPDISCMSTARNCKDSQQASELFTDI
jgi:hypothetical protein